MKKFEVSIVYIIIVVIIIVALIASNCFAIFFYDNYIRFLDSTIDLILEVYNLAITYLSERGTWFSKQNYELTFTNREQASIILYVTLIALILIGDIKSNKIAKSFGEVVKSASRLISIYIVGLLYLLMSVFVLYKLEFWDFYMTKDSVLWLLAYYALLMKFPSMIAKENWIRAMLLEGIKLVVIVEFIVATYTLSLFWEIGIASILLFVNLLSIPADSPISRKLNERISMIAGLIIIIVAFSSFYKDLKMLDALITVKLFVLPLVLSVVYIPHSIYFSLLVSYDHIFCRLDLNKKRSWLFIIYLKYKVFRYCGFKSVKVYELWREKNHILLNAETKVQLQKAFE